jgi:hypothetical protein
MLIPVSSGALGRKLPSRKNQKKLIELIALS